MTFSSTCTVGRRSLISSERGLHASNYRNTTEVLSIIKANIKESSAFSLDVNVKETMLLVFMNGKEIARHPVIAPEKLDYVVSKILYELEEVNEGFSAR